MDFLLRLLNGILHFGHLDFRDYVKRIVGHGYSGAGLRGAGAGGPTSNPRIDVERLRSVLTRRTVSIIGAACGRSGEGFGGSGLAGGGTAGFIWRAVTTRRVISSTIDSIAPSNASVMAARTCSESTTATNGTAAAAA